MKLTNSLLALVLLSCGAPLLAHEFWIEPSSHQPRVGEVLSARLMVGHADHKEAYARNPKHLAHFRLWSEGAHRDLVGRAGDDPSGKIRVQDEGTLVVSYLSTLSQLEMEPEKFEAYLIEEGLEGIVAERKRRGETQKSGLEAYRRCAKSLLRTSAGTSRGYDALVGLPLELIPLSDPLAHEAGPKSKGLGVRLLSDGKPLEGAKVHAQSLDHLSLDEVAGRTNERGEVRFALPRGGRWIVSAVSMKRAAEGQKHDWESNWASISFEVRDSKAEDGSLSTNPKKD